MITTVAYAWIGSVVVFGLLLAVVSREKKIGRRYLASRTRAWLDVRIDSVSIFLQVSWEHFAKYIVQLHWYYSIHSVLRTLLRFIVRFYTFFENLFERNRARTKQLRAEKRQLHTLNHLRQMAEHKEDTALTPTQKRKLRHKKLEEKH